MISTEKLEGTCWQDDLSQDPKNNFKISTKREKKFRKTFEKMEWFSFVTPVTGLNRPNTGKEDDNDDDVKYGPKLHKNKRWNITFVTNDSAPKRGVCNNRDTCLPCTFQHMTE
jgi:hypothetical protein